MRRKCSSILKISSHNHCEVQIKCNNSWILLKGESTHNSFKFFNPDMTGGIGPSKDVPCKSLQKKTSLSFSKIINCMLSMIYHYFSPQQVKGHGWIKI